MSRSIAATVLANAKKQEAEDLKNAKSIIISAVQEDMDKQLDSLEEWIHITVKYNFTECDRLLPEEVQKVAWNLGFDCRIVKEGFYIAIPLWKKGEKKTTAQLMLYHHQMALRKRIKDLKAEALVVAKRDCQEVLTKLKEGKYKIKYDDREYIVTVEIRKERWRMNFYHEQVKSIMEARGFKDIVLLRDAWLIYMPKNK